MVPSLQELNQQVAVVYSHHGCSRCKSAWNRAIVQNTDVKQCQELEAVRGFAKVLNFFFLSSSKIKAAGETGGNSSSNR